MSLAAPTEAETRPSLFWDLLEPIGGNSELPWRTWSLSPERHLVEVHEIPSPILGSDWTCESLVEENPPFHRFGVGEASSLWPTFTFFRLYFFAHSPADLVIAVRTPGGEVFCNDDEGPLGTINPGVELHDAAPGSYLVWLAAYGPTPPGAKTVIGVFTDDFPWVPRVGSLRLTEEGLEQAFGRKITLRGTHFVADTQPGCQGLFDPFRPDFAIISQAGDKGLLLSLESEVPVVLVVEQSDLRVGCTQSTEENGTNVASLPLVETIDGVYRVWAGPLVPEGVNAEARLIVYPLLRDDDEDGSGSRGGGLESNRRLVATGTGFLVSPEGHVVTNEHVIKGCVDPHIRLNGGLPEPLELVLSDPDVDLALLKGSASADMAFLAWDPPKVGADVVVYGFPLAGAELSSAGNVQIGIVSASTGPGDDPLLMQISAGLQPGNSGGPILDRTGSVIGVAWATSKDTESLRERGLVLKNVNFAIRQDVLVEFLRAAGVRILKAWQPDRKDVETIVENARRFTGMILCTL